jgi:hypothetical protein
MVVALALPAIARAEPVASMAHLPFLWLVAGGASAALAWISVKLIGRSGRLQSRLAKWAVAIILFIVFLVLLPPFIVGLGSILITGRTM